MRALKKNTKGVLGHEVEPHHLPKPRLNDLNGVFLYKGQVRDKKSIMKPFTIPVIRKSSPDKWYIEFHYDVPEELQKTYNAPRKRFKKYGHQLNTLRGEAREIYAEELREEFEFALRYLNYNPFDKEIDKLKSIFEQKEKEKLTVEQLRKLTTVKESFALYLESRKSRTKNVNSISTHRGTIKWLSEYFTKKNILEIPASKITRMHIAEAVTLASTSKDWSNTTYNNGIDNANTLLNWLASEEYIDKNPALGKIEKKPQAKSMHRWYDRKTAIMVKAAILDAGLIELYRACQFTYWIMIRSQSELYKLKVGDIDRDLKRVHFRKELSKNNTEQFRDYPAEFDLVLNEMDFDNLPKDYYVFGRFGKPDHVRAGKNTLANYFKKVKDKLKLSEDYTIYGWKHTRIVHLMMLGVDGYEITYKARHSDTKTTDDYKRDYDFTLVNVYKKEDLTF